MDANNANLRRPDANRNPAIASVMHHVNAARAIMRTVALAADALEDGSVSYDDKAGPERWNAAVGKALERMGLARDILTNKSFGMGLDWFTPHALIEALDAALWHGFSCDKPARLNERELVSAAQVAVESLDALLRECEGAASGSEVDPANASAVH